MPSGQAEELAAAMAKALEPAVEELKQIRRLLENGPGGASGGGGSSGSPGIGSGRGRSSGFSASRAGAMFSHGGIARGLSGGVSGALGGGALGGLAGGAAGLAGAAAFDAASYVLKPAWKGLKAGVVNSITDVANGTSGTSREAFTRNLGARASEGLEQVPFIGGAFKSANDPVRSAGERLKGITTQIARFGGTIDPEQRKRDRDRYEAEDRRAQAEAKEVDKLTRERLGSDEVAGIRSQNVENSMNRLIELMSSFFSVQKSNGGVR